MHEFLMLLTSTMPMKTIAINNEDYLQRYYAGQEPDGTQYWLHRFLRDDSERHLHSHPWSALSHILCGWYRAEEVVNSRNPMSFSYSAGNKNQITPETIHRIAKVDCNTRTLMIVQPERLPEWFFIDDEGNKKFIETSPPDWWKNCTTRNGQPAIIGKINHSVGKLTFTVSNNTAQLQRTIADLIAADEHAAQFKTVDEYRNALADAIEKNFAETIQISEKIVLMPRQLTAENGAKAALMGEFHEVLEMTCHECDEDDDECEFCNGDRQFLQKVPVDWTTIKAIYAKAVEVCEVKSIS